MQLCLNLVLFLGKMHLTEASDAHVIRIMRIPNFALPSCDFKILNKISKFFHIRIY
jgi:hypothetical protein